MQSPLAELAALFFRLGATAFGGPAAHVAMMRDEVVRRRGWMSDREFLDLLGATNLIPGPNSTEMAIHIGHRRAGFAGLVVAGSAFIVPAALITLAFAWAYVRWGTLPAAGWLLYGVKPVVIAIVAQAIAGLAPAAARNGRLWAVGALVAVAVGLGTNEIATLLAAGGVTIALAAAERRRDGRSSTPGAAALLLAPLALAATPPVAAAAATVPITTSGILWVFAKIGSILFGSGYVLLAFLDAELVERLGWLGEGQLIDAIAVGQLTPGPVFTTATFVGYVLAGGSGALAATVGIFLPAFVFVAASAPLVPRLRRSWIAAAFLDGVNVASLALMAVVVLQLFGAAIVDATTTLLVVTSAILLVRYRVNSTWLILGGALAGWLAHALG